MQHWSVRLPLAYILLGLSVACFGQENQSNSSRKVVSRAVPDYPELARGMHLGGTVKVEAVVLPNGTVKTVAIRGGPPVLTNAAADAVRKWKWAPAAHETREPVEVKFNP
jgi:TonB family protein